jgi:hypothetical protein
MGEEGIEPPSRRIEVLCLPFQIMKLKPQKGRRLANHWRSHPRTNPLKVKLYFVKLQLKICGNTLSSSFSRRRKSLFFVGGPEGTRSTRRLCAMPRPRAGGPCKQGDPPHGIKISLILKWIGDPHIRD